MRLDRKSFLLSEFNAPYYNRRIWVLSRRLASIIPGGGRVLDLGCGDGQLALAVSKLRPDLEIEGIDYVVRSKTLIPVRAYDGKRLPYADKSFDFVTIVDVLHHTSDPAALLAEAERVARHGVVVKDHLREGFLGHFTLSVMDWLGNVGDGVPVPFNFLDRSEWMAAFQQARLDVTSMVEKLGIYVPPISWLCERNLHFVALTRPARA